MARTANRRVKAEESLLSKERMETAFKQRFSQEYQEIKKKSRAIPLKIKLLFVRVI